MNVDPTQTEPLALEFAAHQRVRLGDYSGAVQDFGKLAQWAETASNPMLRSRALKFQAEIHECRNESQPNVHVATRLQNTAIQIFPTPLTQTEIIAAAELRSCARRRVGFGRRNPTSIGTMRRSTATRMQRASTIKSMAL